MSPGSWLRSNYDLYFVSPLNMIERTRLTKNNKEADKLFSNPIIAKRQHSAAIRRTYFLKINDKNGGVFSIKVGKEYSRNFICCLHVKFYLSYVFFVFMLSRICSVAHVLLFQTTLTSR